MLLALPTITISGRTYKPATSATNMVKFLLKHFDDEAFSSSELVSDLVTPTVTTVFKFNDENNTYILSFSGHKDEFGLISGPVISRDMIKETIILLDVNALNDRLQNEGVQYWKTGLAWFQGKEPTTVFAN